MKILEHVKNCKRIGISGHENPDGDCAGSCCGLALFLRKVLPQAQIDIYLEELPGALARSIPGADTIIHDPGPEPDRYDAFIILDSTPERTGKAYELYRHAEKKINIDHHRTNKGSADAVLYIDANASSASELVYEVIEKEAIDREIAQALYVGIVTDTGVFQYSNTSESTMRAAGYLMTFGFDFSALIREVFFERTFTQAKILGTALTRSELLCGGKLILCVLERADLEEAGAQRKDLDGISAQMALTEGVDCSVFVHESGPQEWRASLRSTKVTDVSRIARLFEGGGHIRASGCTILTDPDRGRDISACLDILTADIEKQLRDAGVI